MIYAWMIDYSREVTLDWNWIRLFYFMNDLPWLSRPWVWGWGIKAIMIDLIHLLFLLQGLNFISSNELLNVEKMLIRIMSQVDWNFVFFFNLLFNFFNPAFNFWRHLFFDWSFNLWSDFLLCFLVIKQNQATHAILFQKRTHTSFSLSFDWEMFFLILMMNLVFSLLNNHIVLQSPIYRVILINRMFKLTRIR